MSSRRKQRTSPEHGTRVEVSCADECEPQVASETPRWTAMMRVRAAADMCTSALPLAWRLTVEGLSEVVKTPRRSSRGSI